MTLLDCLGLNAMKIDRKLLALVGDTPVLPFSQIYDIDGSLEKQIVVGKNISLSDTYRAVQNSGLNYLIQEQHDHFIYNLLMASIINRFPDAFLKNPLPTIMRSADGKDNPSMIIPFSSSKDKSTVMKKTDLFLADNQRLGSVQSNILLIANELMMNALYCAPTGQDGEHLYLKGDRSDDVQFEDGKEASLSIAFNDNVAVLGCRDPYGSVNKSMVTKRLNEVFQGHKKASVQGKNDRSGGSGLGLKLVIEMSTGFGMVVKKNSETFVYATLPLGRGQRTIERMAKNLCLNFYG